MSSRAERRADVSRVVGLIFAAREVSGRALLLPALGQRHDTDAEIALRGQWVAARRTPTGLTVLRFRQRPIHVLWADGKWRPAMPGPRGLAGWTEETQEEPGEVPQEVLWSPRPAERTELITERVLRAARAVRRIEDAFEDRLVPHLAMLRRVGDRINDALRAGDNAALRAKYLATAKRIAGTAIATVATEKRRAARRKASELEKAKSEKRAWIPAPWEPAPWRSEAGAAEWLLRRIAAVHTASDPERQAAILAELASDVGASRKLWSEARANTDPCKRVHELIVPDRWANIDVARLWVRSRPRIADVAAVARAQRPYRKQRDADDLHEPDVDSPLFGLAERALVKKLSPTLARRQT